MRTLIICAVIAPSLALADCPPNPDITDRQAVLLSEVQDAKNEYEARQISQHLWEIWATAPDARAQELLDRGMRARTEFDFRTAWDKFDQLVAYCPDYAEGYNQRAFIAFLQKDYSSALVDLNEALARNPEHIAALAGKALTEIGLNGPEAGQDTLRAALELNPWLSERRFLIEPAGEDI